MHLSTLSEWLAWIEEVHSLDIDLGLARVKEVAERLDILTPACPVIIVGGTNGKGSTVAGLEAIYLEAQYKTAVFTSPFLFKPNEQVRVNGQTISDDALCLAFSKVEAARDKTLLTPFEFFTLAALCVFQTHSPDVMILEVGLGGRLDAVNIIDASVAVITSIAIDHVNWLGDTRELIGREKAGIFRSGRPVVCGDSLPPETIIDAAVSLGSPFYQRGREFDFSEAESSWSFTSSLVNYEHLPRNQLATQNMATVLMALTLLQEQLPVNLRAITSGLSKVNLPGRIQIEKGRITEIFDVSHNPAAIELLKKKLPSILSTGKTRAVFSMLGDKDILTSILGIQEWINDWYVAPLKTKRAASEEALTAAFANAGLQNVTFYSSIQQAYDHAVQSAEPGDTIIIFGSFHTVADVWKHRSLEFNNKR